LVYFFIYYRSPIFRRTHKMIDQNRYIVTFMDYVTHVVILSRRRAAGY
jgi:hypothetical protein